MSTYEQCFCVLSVRSVTQAQMKHGTRLSQMIPQLDACYCWPTFQTCTQKCRDTTQKSLQKVSKSPDLASSRIFTVFCCKTRILIHNPAQRSYHLHSFRPVICVFPQQSLPVTHGPHRTVPHTGRPGRQNPSPPYIPAWENDNRQDSKRCCALRGSPEDCRGLF